MHKFNVVWECDSAHRRWGKTLQERIFFHGQIHADAVEFACGKFLLFGDLTDIFLCVNVNDLYEFNEYSITKGLGLGTTVELARPHPLVQSAPSCVAVVWFCRPEAMVNRHDSFHTYKDFEHTPSVRAITKPDPINFWGAITVTATSTVTVMVTVGFQKWFLTCLSLPICKMSHLRFQKHADETWHITRLMVSCLCRYQYPVQNQRADSSSWPHTLR